MILKPVVRNIFILLMLFSLSACESAEERAEKHYQNALELLANGDVERAIVEFRNVFSLDEGHREARMAYAKATRAQGNVPESYLSFLRIVEQFPDDNEARLALAQMAILNQNWEEAERHGTALIEAQAEIEGAESTALALRFRQAVLDRDNSELRQITAEAEQLATKLPEDRILQRILIEGYRTDGRIEDAIRIADLAISQAPDELSLYEIKNQLLAATGDFDALETQLRATIARFPDNQDAKLFLIQLLTQEGDEDKAEEFLRDEIAQGEDPASAHVSLISFIRQRKGIDAALTETEKALELYPENRLFPALKSGMLFDTGRRDEAIAMLQGVLENADTSNESDRYRISLARMLQASENEVGARQIVEQVLANDPSQTDALKMSAVWLIEADETDQAINALRTALDQEPEDAEAMTLMARAHERAGNAQLAQDLLSLAVEASGNAPPESLRFSQVLIEQERFRSAEDVLVNALRRTPGHVGLLRQLGQVHLRSEDWPRANQVVATLRRQENAQADLVANSLQAQIFARKDGLDRATAFLENLAGNDGGNTTTAIALIRAKITEGSTEEALELANELLAENPDDIRVQLTLGGTQFALRDFASAEETFRSTFEATSHPTAALQLMRSQMAQGRIEDATATLDDAIEKLPENTNLQWAKASVLEQGNDIDGAISIYEELYANDSNSIIIANNLASLLATYRDDEASLDRAFVVARRLRGTEIPALQDTYGWILFRKGDFEEAVTYLEPAAAGLTRDPIVQFHLAKAYLAVGQNDDAKDAFERALELAGQEDPRVQFVEAREELAKLATE